MPEIFGLDWTKLHLKKIEMDNEINVDNNSTLTAGNI